MQNFTHMYISKWFLSSVYFLTKYHAGAVSLPLGDIIWAHLVCPLNGITFCLHQK
jgi:hypothetical protein